MLLKGSKNSLYEARVLSEKKVPKFVRGNYVTKNIQIDGKSIEFKYDEQRQTGLYFRLNNKPLYFAERTILKEKTLTLNVADAKSKDEAQPETPKK